MAENLVQYPPFGGGTSFMSNHYAIWYTGLLNGEGPGKKDQPNRFAVQQGRSYVNRMFDSISTRKNSSFSKFVDYLNAIQRKEADKEARLIAVQINKIRGSNSELPRNVVAAKEAVKDGKFGLAYTILLRTEEELDALEREIKSNHFDNITHTNSYFYTEFYNFFTRKLMEQIDTTADDLVFKDGAFLSLEGVIQDWILEFSSGSDGLYVESLQASANTLRTQLDTILTKHGFDTGAGKKNFLDAKKGQSKMKKIVSKYTTTKSGNKRSIQNQIEDAGKFLTEYLGLGVGQEFAQASRQGKFGFTLNSGKMRKEIEKHNSNSKGTVQITNDVISFISDSTVIDVGGIARDLWQGVAPTLYSQIEELENKLQVEAIRESVEIFEVATNVKGYRSKNDLQIAQTETFLQRMSRLKELGANFPDFSIDKLLFMLNNTMEGCIAENKINQLSDYIAAVCVAWMWDDYSDLFSISESSGITKVHMFSSGGIYYSASEIIRATIDSLYSLVGKAGVSQIFNVTIKPPTFDANSEYVTLRNETYPLNPDMSFEQIQSQLANRWDYMRDKVERTGKIGIKLKQSELEELLGKLKFYIGQQN